MEERDSGYSSLVLRTGWHNTKRAFGSFRRDAIVAISSIFIGALTYWLFFGLHGTVEQVVPIVFFTLGPMAILVIAVTLWSFVIAPAEVVFQALPRDFTTIRAEKPQEPDYLIWRRRENLSIYEFSALLDNVDPESPVRTTNQKAYLALLLEQASLKKLGYEADVFEPTIDSQLDKKVAIAWAQLNGFDVHRLA